MILERLYSKKPVGEVYYFTGREVEHTPAYGMETLFVVGIRDIDETLRLAEEHNVEHIFLGANQSYKPDGNDESEIPWTTFNKSAFITDYEPGASDDYHFGWDVFTTEVTRKFKGYVTLDFSVNSIQGVYEYKCCEYHNFIPLISIKVPHANLLNYNTCVKIDDVGFNKSNPGVWVHRIKDLLDDNKFTPWTKYNNDKIIQGDNNVREDE